MKTTMSSLLLIVCWLPWLLNARTVHNVKHNKRSFASPKLVVVLLDGFRWDYVDTYREDLPGFQRFISQGVRAQWVEPVYPSNSYSNWATIATGLYPESHQLLNNHLYDRNETDPGQVFFSLDHPQTTKLLKYWQHVESIWTTATKQGKRAYLRYWSRCDVPYQGILSEECEGYGGEVDIEDTKKSFELVVQKLLSGFELVMVHVDRIDLVGHAYGPFSVQMFVELKKVDAVLSNFMDELVANQLDDSVNVVIVSDHGMRYVGPGADTIYINLDDSINKNEVLSVMDRGTIASLAVAENSLQNVYSKLKAVHGLDVYLKDEIPEKYHFKGGKYAPDILLVPRKGYLIRGLTKTDKQIPQLNNPNSTWIGDHGYDPEVSDMRAIFFARGPAFKKGFTNPPISMVDIYQVYGHVLNIVLQPHNGTWSRVRSMFCMLSWECDNA